MGTVKGFVAGLAVGLALVAGVAVQAREVVVVLDGPDAGVQVGGRAVQFEYVPCLADPQAVWWEDGSARCVFNAR